MIIWSRWGFLVPIIAVACLVATELLVEKATNDDRYYQEHGWPKSAALSVAAVTIWPLGRFLNRRERERPADTESFSEVVFGGRSSFFFIPMEYWAPLLLVFAFLASFLKE